LNSPICQELTMRQFVVRVLLLFAFAFMAPLPSAYAQEDEDAILLATISKAQENCEKSKQKVAELERVAAQPTTTPQKRAETVEYVKALKSNIAAVDELNQQPMPKTKAELKQRATLLAGAAADQRMLTRFAEKSLGIAPSTLQDRVLDTNGLSGDISDFKTKVSRGFDGASGSYDPDPNAAVPVAQPNYFGIAGSRPQATASKPETSADYRPTTQQFAKTTTEKDGSWGGGVMLEGEAAGLGRVSSVQFDGALNALVMDNRLVYFLKVPPWSAAALARAIAQDDKTRVGVSMTGDENLLFGSTTAYQNTELATDLLLADGFLGDIVFAKDDWTRNYRYPKGAAPKYGEITSDMAVRFAFRDFRFSVSNGELRPVGSALDVRLVPLAQARTGDGGLVPDYAALGRGYKPPPEFVSNARIITDNIEYFRREPIVEKTFSYGEAAAVLRSLKASGINLNALVQSIARGGA
jgi:hypothetical protein